MPSKILQTINKLKKKEVKSHQAKLESQWYNLRPILGYANICEFFVLLGSRETGKSYAVMDFLCHQYKYEHIPFKWIRLTKLQAQKLLQNNAMDLVDPDIRRRYELDLVTSGHIVYNVLERSNPDKKGNTKILKKEVFCEVYDLSTYYSDKGSRFDKDFLDKFKGYNIAIDEFQREKNERNTFDIAYALVNQLENLVRSTKDRMKIFFMGNTLEEASDILAMFGFIPETFGTFKLVKNKKTLIKYLEERRNAKNEQELMEIDAKYSNYDFGKRCVIQYIEPNKRYLNRRKHTVADILMPTASTFTNVVTTDNTLIRKKRKGHCSAIIKFTKDKKDWFSLYEGTIFKYNNENTKSIISMRPYLDEFYNQDMMKNVINLFDTRSFSFSNLITFKLFEQQLSILRKSK